MSLLKSKWIQYALLTVIICLVGNTLIQHISFSNLSDINISIPFVLLSILFEFGARFFIGVGFYQLLKYSGTPLSLNTSVAISWISFLGKYLPGKIALIASAIYFLKQQKIPTTIAGIVPILNTLMTIFTALVFSIPLIFSGASQILFPFIYVAPFLIVGLFFSFRPKCFFFAINIVLSRFGLPKIPVTFSSLQICACLGIVGMQCLFAGISTWLLSCSIFMIDISLFPRVISITAFSGVMGLLAVFSPAGIGIRDGLYYLTLSNITGQENAALITIILRLVHTIVDVGAALTGLIFLKMKRITFIEKGKSNE